MLAGFPERNVREIAVGRALPDPRGRSSSARSRDDRAAGKQPFLVVGNAGSVNTGAVDDLAALADLAARERSGSTWTGRTAASFS